MARRTVRTKKPKKNSRAARKQSRRIKLRKGGAKALLGNTDLSEIWNYMFKQRAPTKMVIHEMPKLSEGKKKALFVIDMQNDFVDRYYDRKNPNEMHPVWKDAMYLDSSIKDLHGSGNFAVAAGSEMVEDMTNYVKHAIESADYSHIIFSRDYHPVGHSSFNKNAFYEQHLCGVCGNSNDNKCIDDDGGVFPAHCVQGKEGAKIIDELEHLITNNEKIKIVFKGVHPHCDSYTAVEKINIDTIASNKKHVRNETSNKLCSSISGGYRLHKQLSNDATAAEATAEESKTFNDAFDYIPATKQAAAEFKCVKESNVYTLQKETYKYLEDVEVIEVCGLAGDYCVRDTVVALARKYKEKQIVLLNDLTRYPVLPFGTISIIPQHQSSYLSNADSLPDYKNEIKRIQTDTSKSPTDASKPKSDITDYLILMDAKKRLLTPMEVKNVTAPGGDNPDYWVILNEGDGLTKLESPAPAHKPIGHFITPSKYIIDDYNSVNKTNNQNNIKIHMQKNPLENTPALNA